MDLVSGKLTLLVCVLAITSCMPLEKLLQVEASRTIPVLCTHDYQCKQYCEGAYRCENGSCTCLDYEQAQEEQPINQSTSFSTCARDNDCCRSCPSVCESKICVRGRCFCE
ncbi:uncharacterized protein LOC110411607 [Herrania umbratica]|uniref:Uncharacterized protein LOC110411607 n=1 Tax=Herrania umbratica TaxID=108875 RepID=A0A6J0ZSD7_9ROSI|nr:uncharacterized protein LOC110411607 [Herrania umbratica]